MKTIACLVLAVAPTAVAFAQAPAPAATGEKTAAQTASPELVGQLATELGIKPAQAEGAAGTLFGVAKTRLSADDFTKVSSAVPNMDGLLKAAPAAPASAKASALEALTAKASAATGAGSLGSMAAAAGALSQLGLSGDTIAKLAPALVKVVQTKGGAEVASLLAGALK